MADLSPEKGTDRLVAVLALAVAIASLGANAFLPLLPEYVRHQGGSDALVGVIMASFFAAGLLAQFPAGWLADRVGGRPVLLGGLLVFSGASLAFATGVGPLGAVLLRSLQGVGAGAELVAALAMLSLAVPIERRGRAVGTIYGALLAGAAVGPLVGSLAGLDHLPAVFVASAVASVAACIPVLVGTQPGPRGSRPPAPPLPADLWRRRALVGALITAAANGLVIGVYESCWTLLLQYRGAEAWQIGLSWTLFSVPFVAMSRPGGWLADHFDRRPLVIVPTVVSIAFCATYPFVASLPLLLAFGALESAGIAVALPAAQSLLTQDVPAEIQGRVQGLFATSETGATAVSAFAGGALFGAAPWAPFVAGAAGALALTAVLPVLWAPVRGRVLPDPRPGPAPAG